MQPWFSRIKREFEAGNLTRAYYAVLCELGRFGECRFGLCPSHATLAARARCSTRTVRRALQAARELGLLDWAARRVRVAWRSLRTSNRYVLSVPPRPVATGGQFGRRVTYERKKAPEQAPLWPALDRLEALAALERVRRQREAVLLR